MGIPSYFVHIVKTYPTVIKEFIPNKIKIDNFYIDSNSVIYDAIKSIAYKKGDVTYESNVNKWICEKLLFYINLIMLFLILIFIFYDFICFKIIIF